MQSFKITEACFNGLAWSILVNILHTLKKNANSAILGPMVYVSQIKFVNCVSHIYYYCLVNLSFVERSVLNTSVVFMDLSFKVSHSYYIALKKIWNNLYVYQFLILSPSLDVIFKNVLPVLYMKKLSSCCIHLDFLND